MTTGSSRRPDLDRGLVPPLAGDDLEPVAALADDERLDDALLGDRRHQLGQVAHDLARLVRVRVELVDRHHAGRSARRPSAASAST